MAESNEIWKSIAVDGFEQYQVSNLGRFRRKMGDKYKLIKCTQKKEYMVVSISNGKARKDTELHILILTAFHGPPPFEKAQVNHKNGDKMDNRLENLEWVTASDNIRHAFKTGLMMKNNNSGNKKGIQLVDKEGNVLETFSSSVEAGKKMNCDSSGITKVCKGKIPSVKGMIFRYVEEIEDEKAEDLSGCKVIPNFTKYMIDRNGNVFRKKDLKKMAVEKHGGGTLRTSLKGDDKKRHSVYIHRLVAQTYIENPDNKANVMHMDGNLLNNSVENLRWCSNSETVKTANKKRPAVVNSRPIYQVYDGKIVERFNSITEAANKLGVVRDAIGRCLWGYCKTSAGFEWKYADEIDEAGIDTTIELEKSEVPVTLKRCIHVYKNGEKKGTVCGSKIRNNDDLCSRHRPKEK